MSNVLPVSEKKRLWIFYRTRFFLVASMSLTVLALIMLVALVPSYLILAKSTPSAVPAAKDAATQAEKTDALAAKALLAQIFPLVAPTTTPMDDILQALDDKPSGVTIDRISYTTDGKSVTIALGGSAAVRENINALRKVLEGKGVYTQVNIPVSALVGATGNDFTVTLVKDIH